MFSTAFNSAQAPFVPQQAFPSVLRVLLVEDNSYDAHMITNVLQKHSATGSFSVVTAARLSLALEMLSKMTFDVILLDLTLPDACETGGLWALRAENRDIPIIIFTNSQDPDMRASAIKCGARYYLTKDHDIFSLKDTIKRALEETGHA